MAIELVKDASGIVTLTIDMPARPVNVLNELFDTAFTDALSTLEQDDALTGVVITSGKQTFVVGADIDTMFTRDDPRYYFETAEYLKAQFRRLETLGKPVVAAINGTALGGGLELALACHHRIALDDGRIQLGFPEVGLGLLPGAGGIARTIRLAGIQKGLEWLAQNKKYTPRQALADGLIHALAATHDEMMQAAREWILAHPAPQAPWDSPGFKIPGGAPHQPHIAQMLAIGPAYLRRETRGNYPAPHAIMAAAVEGAQVDFATACRIESRYFAHVATSQVSKNMITAFWHQLNHIKKGASRPAHIPPQPTTKVGVLGAGMMGHGIAYVSAMAGMSVILIDISQEAADSGKARMAALLEKRVSRGRMTPAEMSAVLARVQATAVYDHLAGCDLIIEAVFEDRTLKANVTRQAEAVIDTTAVVASNTSTLPITGLAQASQRPAQFIGLHFFSPVDKMNLVEIIVGQETSPITLAKAFDYVLAISKVPIVVKDSRGFYTSRVFATWTHEALAMLAEGQHPHTIEMAGLQAGMPVGPLALLDELSLTLVNHIRQQTRQDIAATGSDTDTLLRNHPAYEVVDKMVALNRPGRAGGGGFYEYEDGGKRLWPGLMTLFHHNQPPLPMTEMIDRILYIQAIEAVRCLQEGVVQSVADANLGAIFGWGFAPFHGGPLQFINATGVEAFMRRAEELAATYGDRFAPPWLLQETAVHRKTFH